MELPLLDFPLPQRCHKIELQSYCHLVLASFAHSVLLFEDTHACIQTHMCIDGHVFVYMFMYVWVCLNTFA